MGSGCGTHRGNMKEREPLEDIKDVNNGAYYGLWNLVNSGLSLAVGFKHGILCCLKMARLYRNISELRV